MPAGVLPLTESKRESCGAPEMLILISTTVAKIEN